MTIPKNEFGVKSTSFYELYLFGFFCEKHKKVIMKKKLIFLWFYKLKMVKKMFRSRSKQKNCYNYLNLWQKKFPTKSSRMATHMNCMVIQSLQRQLDQVAIPQNEKKNVIKEKLLLLNDPTKFHTLERI